MLQSDNDVNMEGSQASDTAPVLAVGSLRVSRLGRAAAALALIAAAVSGLSTVAIWADPDLVRDLVAPPLHIAGRPLGLDATVRALGFLAAATPVALFMIALVEVARMFWSFAAGRVFELETARRIRLIGAAAIGLAFANPLAGIVESALLTAGNPKGGRVIALSFAYQDCAALIAGLALIAFAAAMQEAARLSEVRSG